MRKPILFASFLAVVLAGSSISSSSEPAQPAKNSKPPANAQQTSAVKPSQYRSAALPVGAAKEYEVRWGVDQLAVSLAESGQLVRFSYRVTNAARAAIVHDKAATPYLLDEKVHAVLQVPIMEKVGPLRQAGPPEYGKSYWMVFSNKGNIVKAGHRVSIVIGQFRVDGLVVQK
jgi:hypothetical protein